MDVSYKHKTYTTYREKPLRIYVDHMVAYLQLHHPTATVDDLRAFVETQTKARLQSPTVDALYHPTPGNTERKTVRLMTHLNDKIGQNIIAPSGTVYVTPTSKESFLRATLADKKIKRGIYKKAMLKALAVGDLFLASINNLIQASTKIFLNSAPGAMGSPHNPLYDLAGYNSNTSIPRHCVKYGYAHVERLLEGNLYIKTYGEAVNYCLGLIKVIPPTWPKVLVDYQLYIPSPTDVVEYLASSLRYYMMTVPRKQISDFITRLSEAERSFIFYASNLRNLVRFNDERFRNFFHTFFLSDVVVDHTVDPKSVFSIEHDLLAMITSINYALLGRDPETGNYWELDQAVMHNPSGVQHIIAIARHMQTELARMSELLVCLFRIDADLPNLKQQENMIRKSVIVSDTDSVIFSTQSMVEWYSGEINFKRNSYEINAFSVYLISRTLEHVFARQSCGFGMVGSDIYMITMKNEFLYPVMMRSPIKKHYAGLSTIQEGKILATIKKDIKGLQFRSSTLSRESNKAAEAFVTWVLESIISDVKISLTEIYKRVSAFELHVYHSLQRGEKTFLQTASIKDGDDYDDPDRTNHFYYQLWHQVFVPEFDGIQLPNSCYKIPLRDDGRILKDPTFVEAWKLAYATTYDKYQEFIAQWPKKKISMLLIPPTLTAIPAFLREAIDVRAVVHDNCKPFYLTLESLGVGLAYTKSNYLVTDFFNPDNIEIAYS